MVFVNSCHVFVVNVLSHSVEWMALHTIAVLMMRVLKSKMTAVRVFTPDLQTINRDFVLYKSNYSCNLIGSYL